MWAKHTIINKKSSYAAFTIVELLIVIVVIAILAAITIVAFNGVQDRARGSAAAQSSTQAAKRIKLWQVDNEAVTPTCSKFYELVTGTTSGAPADPTPPAAGPCTFTYKEADYQYASYPNGAYCATTTVVNQSYQVSESSAPESGGCRGHGQAGKLPITNLAMNPSIENNAAGWGVANWQGGNGLALRDTSSAQTGNAAFKLTWSTASTGTNSGILSSYASVTPGSAYNVSAYVRSSIAATVLISVRQYTAANGTGTINDIVGSPSSVSVPANTWTRVSTPVTVQAGYSSIALRMGLNYMPAVNNTFAADGLMVTAGSTLYNYADGNSLNWAWNGTQNDVSSTGPPI